MAFRESIEDPATRDKELQKVASILFFTFDTVCVSDIKICCCPC
jgi:hypothetical protein